MFYLINNWTNSFLWANSKQPRWLSLVENEGEQSNCFSGNSKGLQSKTYNIIYFLAQQNENSTALELRARDRFSMGK